MQALQHRTTRGGGAGPSSVPTSSGLALETGTIKGNVPQFLAKLWNMVNDPTTDHLIKWADDGKSFYILDQDRFAKEILGNFYKTENVQSFVRQLNMYGFHKIQHIRQGAMRSSKESQAWQFTNPNFQRGQSDLLCLIARKHKHPEKGNALIVSSTGATIEPIEGPDGERDQLANGEMAMTGKSNGQLDVQGIIGGLAAIKRHQAVISATLKEVQQSNSALWQEAMEARERHRKHQDTINRILKFLASLYQHPSGSPGGAVGVTGGAGKDAVGVIPRPRLMITDSTRNVKTTKQEDTTPMATSGNGVRLEEIELLGDDIPAGSTPLPYTGLSPTVETPGPLSSFIEPISTPTSIPNKNPSAPTLPSSTNGQQFNATPSTGTSANARPIANPDAWNPAWNSALIQNLLQMNPQLWNGMQNKGFQLPFTSQPQPDNSMALTQVNQAQNNNMPMSASAIQQLLQGIGPYFPAATAPNSINSVNHQQLANGSAFNNIFDPTVLSASMASTNAQPPMSTLSDLMLPPSNDVQLQGLMQSSQQLNAINEGVSHVDEHINHLINSMPVDPATASSFRSGPSAEMTGMGAASGDVNGIQEAIDDEVDLDAFWRQLGFGPGFGTSAGTNLPASTTTDADIDPALFLESLPQHHQDGLSPGGFLDEVATSPLLPSNASDITMADSLVPPGVAGFTPGGGRATRKRKSDAADLSPPATAGQKTTGSRTKRKR